MSDTIFPDIDIIKNEHGDIGDIRIDGRSMWIKDEPITLTFNPGSPLTEVNLTLLSERVSIHERDLSEVFRWAESRPSVAL